MTPLTPADVMRMARLDARFAFLKPNGGGAAPPFAVEAGALRQRAEVLVRAERDGSETLYQWAFRLAWREAHAGRLARLEREEER